MELLFPLLLVALLVPMFLGVRRQKRESEKTASMQENLKIGDMVTTTSGLFGTVVELDDDTVDLEIAEDVVTTWLRAAIRDVRTVDAPADETGVTPAEARGDETATDEPSTAVVEESAAQTETRLTKD
ncbi:preprotein translocase subunit YajC [Nocardia arizonensis]|uniref:preprotein translocase subunit YajC n=1 Tax=Nocardia arizonensis TaxID=1141647 RepID=UPI0006D007FE|nr:preprotein translocase subunit YajC [Nocardia arizonensis]